MIKIKMYIKTTVYEETLTGRPHMAHHLYKSYHENVEAV